MPKLQAKNGFLIHTPGNQLADECGIIQEPITCCLPDGTCTELPDCQTCVDPPYNGYCLPTHPPCIPNPCTVSCEHCVEDSESLFMSVTISGIGFCNWVDGPLHCHVNLAASPNGTVVAKQGSLAENQCCNWTYLEGDGATLCGQPVPWLKRVTVGLEAYGNSNCEFVPSQGGGPLHVVVTVEVRSWSGTPFLSCGGCIVGGIFSATGFGTLNVPTPIDCGGISVVIDQWAFGPLTCGVCPDPEPSNPYLCDDGATGIVESL